MAFLPIAEQFDKIRTWIGVPVNFSPFEVQIGDTPNADRISLLLTWWHATKDLRFADCALKVATQPVDGFDGWRDGEDLVHLLTELRDSHFGEGFPCRDELIELLECGLIDLVRWANAEDLERISDAVDSAGSSISPSVAAAVGQAIHEEFEQIEERIRDEDSESSLEERIASLKKWAPRYSIPQTMLDAAVSMVRHRIAVIEDATPSSEAPNFTRPADEPDIFDDAALKNLFAPLVADFLDLDSL
jgi:hypothetical protein